ncbi:MAG: DOPA 4,5-dioxygenase family protein [Rubrivivax sp.]
MPTSAGATADPIAETAAIRSYHAHIYFDPQATRGAAAELRQHIGEHFSVQLGRWHDVPVGPHSSAMYQVAFAVETFAAFVPWLMLNRRGLDVLVHPNTLAPHDDHVHHALWLGEKLPLRPEVLPVRIEEADESQVVPNTTPTRSAPQA